MDKLYFYSKSRAAKPGHGVNEIIMDPEKYTDLSPHFRRVLSNFHVYKFEYNGHSYNSIEHAFQACKIALVDPEKSLWFTSDNGHEIGMGDGAIAQKNRKLVKLDKDHLQLWDSIKDKVMKDISIAKYHACEEATHVLKATREAQLWHIVCRKPPVRFVHLEEIRSMLD